jgi:phospholipid/cholesterol/gamma-HCH transport system substrate-binding protein
MRRRWATIAVLAAALVAGGCSVQTVGAPSGDLTLYATFDDVQDLTRGHFVEVANVVVGSVGDIELDGHRARVRLDVDSDRELPVGTSAVVRRTSLLGEHFVDLMLPPGFVPGEEPTLRDGAEITETDSQVEIETLADYAGGIVTALDPQAVAATLDAGDRALASRGARLNDVIGQTAEVVGTLRGQQEHLTATVDAIAAASDQFASRADELAGLVGSLDDATRTVAANRDRAVATAQQLVDLARTTSEVVLAPHTERIVGLVQEASAVFGALAARSESLSGLFADIAVFNSVLPDVVANGQVLIQAWLDPTVLFGGAEGLTDPVNVLTTLLGILL